MFLSPPLEEAEGCEAREGDNEIRNEAEAACAEFGGWLGGGVRVRVGIDSEDAPCLLPHPTAASLSSLSLCLSLSISLSLSLYLSPSLSHTRRCWAKGGSGRSSATRGVCVCLWTRCMIYCHVSEVRSPRQELG